MLGRERARRERLDKKFEEIGLALPRSVSPRTRLSPQAQERPSEEGIDQATQPSLHREYSDMRDTARYLLDVSLLQLLVGVF